MSIITSERTAPWGTAAGDPTTFATRHEMLEAAGMANWNVQKHPLVTIDGIEVPRFWATVRSDNNQVLGVVGDVWQPVQIEEAFAFGDNIVDSGDANWSRAGMFRSGQVVFGCLEVGHLEIEVPGDDGGSLKAYLLILTSFDGSTPTEIVVAYIRPICWNTFQMARGGTHKFTARHTSSLEGRIVQARESLGVVFRNAELVKDMTARLATTKVVDQQVQDIFRRVWPIDEEAASDRRLVTAPSTQAYLNYLHSDTLDGIRGTAWGAFNAATEYLDHMVEYRAKTSVAPPDQIRGRNLMFGTASRKKDAVLRELLALSR